VTGPFVDTDVIIRYVTGDDPRKQEEAAALFERVERGELTLRAPDTVIADAVFVLASPRLYGIQRADVAEALMPLVRSPGFQVENKRILERALQLYGSRNFGFGDAMIVATMEQEGVEDLYSYATDFDRIPSVKRRTPS
jgi:predicted nucleic acid-binding protein